MFYDLNVPWTDKQEKMQRTIAFLDESAPLRPHYDLLAARPTTDRTLQLACTTLDIDIISLDLSLRWESHYKYSTIAGAIARGIRFEICYSQALLGDAAAKRNLIANATQLIRVSRGRGLIFSSEAKSILGLRAPSDIVNLADCWGLGHERGKDGLSREARGTVESARLRKESWKGPVVVAQKKEEKNQGANKRKGDVAEGAGRRGGVH
ncbi:ribonuclease P/MRP 30 subunit [Dendryphion nanum]|uniref:Ribonuclease P/MRP 30 subunit n=1 Tax=Dendryphion nanum TaxID=256645 RepID=A0A9P9ILC7_9PLEO|nr:ribonuclease P/MRP 30 subunit [Dendryphion nanum]